MASHSDDDHGLRKQLRRVLEDFPDEETALSTVSRLRQRGEEMTLRRENEITAGKVGEEVLYDGMHKGVLVRRLPDDPDGVLRISVGEYGGQAYLVFRGNMQSVDALLSRALKALRKAAAEDRGGEEGDG